MIFNDRYGGSPPMIVIEPARPGGSQAPPPRGPEIKVDASTSTAKGPKDWLKTELAWGFVHFVRVLFTVFVYRGFHHLFTKGWASQQAFDQAPDLWTKGKRDQGFRRSTGGYSGGGNGGTGFRFRAGGVVDPPWWTAEKRYAGASAASGSVPPDVTEADLRKLGRVGPYSVYHNRTVLDRATQFFACKPLYRTPCENCRFLVADPEGMNHCAAELKAKMLREEHDDGSDLEEIRERIRRGHF